MLRIQLVIAACLILITFGVATASDEEELAKQSQNPIANLISLPLELNTNFNVGKKDATTNVFNIKPIYPVNLGEWNLIHRGILPVIYQEERFQGEGSEFGMGDFNYQGFFTPAKAGKIIWGVGPSLVIPTHTDDRLGSDKWSAGPTALVLSMPGNWVVGVLAQNVWSFAGPSGEDSVNQFLCQYFCNYNLGNGWYIASTPTITSNWKADSSDQWTVPFGGGIGRTFRIGKQAVDLKAQVFNNVVRPDNAGNWSAQVMFKLLFPK